MVLTKCWQRGRCQSTSISTKDMICLWTAWFLLSWKMSRGSKKTHGTQIREYMSKLRCHHGVLINFPQRWRNIHLCNALHLWRLWCRARQPDNASHLVLNGSIASRHAVLLHVNLFWRVAQSVCRLARAIVLSTYMKSHIVKKLQERLVSWRHNGEMHSCMSDQLATSWRIAAGWGLLI